MSRGFRGLTLEQAEMFLSMASHQTYAAVAAELHTSTKATQKMLVRLTEAVGRGDLVLSRKRGSYELTETGYEILTSARVLIGTAREILGAERPLRVGAYPNAARAVAAKFEDNPPFVFDGVGDHTRGDAGTALIRRVASGQIDMAIAGAGQLAEGLKETLLYEWTVRVVVPQSWRVDWRSCPIPRVQQKLAGDRALSIEVSDLSGVPLVVAPVGHLSRSMVQAAFAARRVHAAVAMEIDDQATMKALALNSVGLVALVPDDALTRGDLTVYRALTADGRPLIGRISLYMRDEPPSPHTERLRTAEEYIVSALSGGPHG